MTQSNSKPDIFIYKMTADNGGAPCVDNEVISLCICQTRMRPVVTSGDWIIGIGGKSASKLLKNRLIYIMQVKECVKGSEYYMPGSKYENRSDCIYEWDGNENEYKLKACAKYHSKGNLAELKKGDLGEKPEYKKAICLVGDKFAYFGDGKYRNPGFESIKEIENYNDFYNRSRSYRKNHNSEDYKLLRDYICRIMEKHKGWKGIPTN